MQTNENQQNLQKKPVESAKIFWLCFAVLFLAVVLFHAKTIPYSNEFVYLLRLKSDFLPNDWTFSKAANEHWLFNFIFSFPAKIFAIEIVGWAGRIAVWSLSLIGLLKLGKRCGELSFPAIAASVFLWLSCGQSIVGEEWIFGGFEAKTVSFVCLLFALNEFSKRKIILPAILLGLTFSFHPAVGLWAIPAVGLALLLEKFAAIDFLKIVGLTFFFSLPGLLPLFSEQISAGANSFEDWRFVVLYRIAASVDMFQFDKSDMLLLFLMLAFNCLALWKSNSFALRFLLKFQICLGAIFLFGLLLRVLELYPLLRFMPMRLFPLFTPLFFFFTAFHFIPRVVAKQQKAAGLFVVLIFILLNPFGKAYNQIRETAQTRTFKPDDFQKTSQWIAGNTLPDSVIIQPPNRRDVWYFSRRATIVSYSYPTYDRLSEWRERLSELTGNLQISKNETAGEEIENAFNQLPAEQIDKLKQKYGATHLVSRAVYSYPVIYQTETYKVYQLP
jgi:hypothetical protein